MNVFINSKIRPRSLELNTKEVNQELKRYRERISELDDKLQKLKDFGESQSKLVEVIDTFTNIE